MGTLVLRARSPKLPLCQEIPNPDEKWLTLETDLDACSPPRAVWNKSHRLQTFNYYLTYQTELNFDSLALCADFPFFSSMLQVEDYEWKIAAIDEVRIIKSKRKGREGNITKSRNALRLMQSKPLASLSQEAAGSSSGLGISWRN